MYVLEWIMDGLAQEDHFFQFAYGKLVLFSNVECASYYYFCNVECIM